MEQKTIDVELDGEGALERLAVQLVEVSGLEADRALELAGQVQARARAQRAGLVPPPSRGRRVVPLAEGIVLGQLLREP